MQVGSVELGSRESYKGLEAGESQAALGPSKPTEGKKLGSSSREGQIAELGSVCESPNKHGSLPLGDNGEATAGR